MANFLIGHPEDIRMFCGRIAVMIQGVVADPEDFQIIKEALQSFSINPTFAELAYEKGIVLCND